MKPFGPSSRAIFKAALCVDVRAREALCGTSADKNGYSARPAHGGTGILPTLPAVTDIAHMGQFTTIMARDGHEFQSYLAAPSEKARGAVVVIQEIFGLNSHIRNVADSFAAAGYTAIAPAFFDRIRRGIELGYSAEEMQEGRGYMQQLKLENTLKDLGAALAVVKHSGRVATVGYCWGGVMSYVAACELPLAGAVVYYGNAAAFLDRHPKCPVMYHYGALDTHIPLSDVDKIKASHPAGQFFLYEAGHGFNCDQRPSFNADAATLARSRTLDFLRERLEGTAQA